MKTPLDAQINVPAAAPVFTAALGLVAITPGLVAAFGFGGRIYRALGNRGARLSHNRLGPSLDRRILRQGVGSSGRWQGRNLHGHPWASTHIQAQLWGIHIKKTINHYVISCILDKGPKRVKICKTKNVPIRKARP